MHPSASVSEDRRFPFWTFEQRLVPVFEKNKTKKTSSFLVPRQQKVHTGLHMNSSDAPSSPGTCERSKTRTTTRETKATRVCVSTRNTPLSSVRPASLVPRAAAAAAFGQMFTSRTSVGVVERSCPSLTVLVSMATECCCCCACLRLVSSSDSICS